MHLNLPLIARWCMTFWASSATVCPTFISVGKMFALTSALKVAAWTKWSSFSEVSLQSLPRVRKPTSRRLSRGLIYIWHCLLLKAKDRALLPVTFEKSCNTDDVRFFKLKKRSFHTYKKNALQTKSANKLKKILLAKSYVQSCYSNM